MNMKTKSILSIAALSIAILATFTLSSCKSLDDGGGTHTMGGRPSDQKSNYQMNNSAMPGMAR